MFRLFLKSSGFESEKAGTANVNGWYSESVPRASATKGSAMSAKNVKDRRTPPALCTHLPKLSPRVESATIAPTSAQLKSVTNQPLSAIQRTPKAYERFVTTSSPMPDITRMAKTQRFHATMY